MSSAGWQKSVGELFKSTGTLFFPPEIGFIGLGVWPDDLLRRIFPQMVVIFGLILLTIRVFLTGSTEHPGFILPLSYFISQLKQNWATRALGGLIFNTTLLPTPKIKTLAQPKPDVQNGCLSFLMNWVLTKYLKPLALILFSHKKNNPSKVTKGSNRNSLWGKWKWPVHME